MPTKKMVVNGVEYTVTTTQKESSLEKYRRVDNHLILGMLGQVEDGTMKDPVKIEALMEVATERGLAVQEA
jgi:hypothetical protein